LLYLGQSLTDLFDNKNEAIESFDEVDDANKYRSWLQQLVDTSLTLKDTLSLDFTSEMQTLRNRQL